MAKKKSKLGKRYDEKIKMAAVARIDSGKSTVAQETKRAGCSQQSVVGWVAKYGTGKKPKQKPAGALPTKDSASIARAPKTKPLVATSFKCPHCGGGIEAAA
jgi:transposase-like protein